MKLRILLAVVLALACQAFAGQLHNQDPEDVRVKPLMDSAWDGGDVGGRPCYNLYTPVLLSSGTNAPCGHIAMMLAQLMRYHRYPEAAVEGITAPCDVDVLYYSKMEDEEEKGKSRVSLSMKGGVYDWDNMPAKPDATMSDKEREAVGKLTSDVGIAMQTAYDEDRSSACVWRIPDVLMSVFGYANACFMGTNDEVDNGISNEGQQANVQSQILANLDVGCPVLLDVRSVDKNSSHDISYMDVVIADGYGYDEGNLYLHIVNRGYSFWRTLSDFDNICGLYFNIFPRDSGLEKTAFTGRVVDSDGEAVANATVNIYPEGGADVAASLTTSDYGVFGTMLPSGKSYEVEVLKEGLPVDRLGPYKLGTQERFGSFGPTEGEKWKYSVRGARDEDIMIKRWNSSGNRWGDVVLPTVAARIVSDGTETVYGSIDAAIIGARELAKSGTAEVTIEVMRDLGLAGGVKVDFPCSIVRAEDAESASVRILRSDDAAMTVTKTGSLTIRGVSFASSATNQYCTAAAIVVKDGGLLRLGSGVDFNMAAEHSSVLTYQTNGLEVVSALTSAFSMQCAASLQVGEAFGVATCAADVAASSAALIENGSDGEGSVRGAAVVREDGTVQLVWSEDVDVPIAAAAGYFVDSSGATRTAPRLDQALKLIDKAISAGEAGASPELVVRDVVGLTLTRLTTVSGALTIRGETDERLTILPSKPSAGFVVPDGASLRMQNLAFDGTSGGYNGNSMIWVKGGSAAVENVAFLNLSGTNSCSPALAVMSGSATVSESLFDGCRTATNAASAFGGPCGGGVYLGQNASLSFSNSTVTNCWASLYGGGIFAPYGARVSLSGDVFVLDNEIGDNVENNITLLQSMDGSGALKKEASLKLSGAVAGAVGVFWRANSGASPRALAGGAFATADSADILDGSAAAFRNDANAMMSAKADVSSLSLVWEESDTGAKEVSEDVASVKVSPADGGRTRYYASVSDAVGTLDGDATVELLGNCALSDDITIGYAVTLKSSGSEAYTLSQTNSTCIFVASGGSLEIADLTLSDDRNGGTLVSVAGGALTLQSGAVVTSGVAGKNNASAIYVNGGTFTMESGSLIDGCLNSYYDEKVGRSVGGGVRVSNESVAWLKGGVITNCVACTGGGIAVTDRSTVYVSGDVRILGNTNSLTQAADDLLVSDNSTLYLSGPLTGAVGISPEVAAGGVVFGRVASDFSGTAAEAANSAHNFTCNLTDDVGIAVKPVSGSGETLLVWSDALDVAGEVTADGQAYGLASGGATLTAAVTDTTTTLYYDGTEKAPEFSGHGFAVDATPQTVAGSYTATLTPKAGFAWSDGTTAARTVSWTIRKSTYAMNLVKFSDASIPYDGEAHSIYVSGTLPDGVSVAYSGNERTDVGNYVVRAKFKGDYANYEEIADMTAVMRIYQSEGEDDSDDDPQPSVATNAPTPIAFESIERLAEGSWRLVVTNRVAWCWYRLLSTSDLKKGFTTTNEWEQAPADATPAWTNDVVTTGEALFWKAEGKEGIVEEE